MLSSLPIKRQLKQQETEKRAGTTETPRCERNDREKQQQEGESSARQRKRQLSLLLSLKAFPQRILRKETEKIPKTCCVGAHLLLLWLLSVCLDTRYGPLNKSRRAIQIEINNRINVNSLFYFMASRVRLTDSQTQHRPLMLQRRACSAWGPPWRPPGAPPHILTY